jgi:hypothetical protein
MRYGERVTVMLRAGVGPDRPNHREDVALVQILLYTMWNRSVERDGLWGPATKASIESFQTAHLGFADAIVDPGDITFQRLRGIDRGAEHDASLRLDVLDVTRQWDISWRQSVALRDTADRLGTVVSYPYGDSFLDVYSHRTFGTWEVYGAIRESYAQLGNDGGVLGNPISGERDKVPAPGRVSWFERGRIVWTPDAGAVAFPFES